MKKINNMAMNTVSNPDGCAARKKNWLNVESREQGNLYLFEKCYRFMKNLLVNYKGEFKDYDVLLPVCHFMSEEKTANLHACCVKGMTACGGTRRDEALSFDPETEDVSILLRKLWRNPATRNRLRVELVSWLKYAADELARWQKESPDCARERFGELQSLFGLSDREVDLLTVAALVGNGIWPCDDFRNATLFSKGRKMAAMLGVGVAEYHQLIGAKSALRRYECLDNEGEINSELSAFLNGVDCEPLANRYYRRAEGAVLPWSFFGALAECPGDLLKRLLASRDSERGMHILLYGEPGTGKTSFALSLAAEAGLKPFLIAHGTENKSRESSRGFRFSAMQVCASQVDPKQSVMIVDEADGLLMGRAEGGFFDEGITTSDKGRLNELLDGMRMPCIWIANARAGSLDASNRRRFDYSLRFEKLTAAQRRPIWRNALVRQRLESLVGDELLDRLSQSYPVSAGGISLAVQNLGAMLSAGQARPEDAEKILKGLLESHCQLLNLHDEDGGGEVTQDYSLEGLNIGGSVPLGQIVEAVRRFRAEQAGVVRQGRDRARMNLLLHGPPGTGKTEFVTYLGTAVGARVVTRMGSDLLDRYVGGTEQNIQAAFREAAEERAILFLDEIDGLVQARERATRSWEVTQVNELLHQMERFEGVLVGATNFVASLDAAALRRFTFKLEFGFLDEAGKQGFFRRMFGPLGVPELSPSEHAHLSRIPNLTPGDYRTVRQGLYYLGENVTAALILEGLERESAAKQVGPGRPVGFVCR